MLVFADDLATFVQSMHLIVKQGRTSYDMVLYPLVSQRGEGQDFYVAGQGPTFLVSVGSRWVC